jgi:hypothetical protein
LGPEFFSRAGRLLRSGSVCLGHCADLRDRRIDLSDAFGFGLERFGDLAESPVDFPDLRDDLAERGRQLSADVSALPAATDGIGDQFGGLRGGVGGRWAEPLTSSATTLKPAPAWPARAASTAAFNAASATDNLPALACWP